MNSARTGVAVNPSNPTIILDEIGREVAACSLCDLAIGRTHAVPGTGSPQAKILFIGEGPGWREDQEGRPFIGPAGKFLDELLVIAGLQRDDVFITNVVKCRPPGNRDPMPDEIAACSGYLDRQIAALNPEVIVTLGRFSMARWFAGERISRIHGQPAVIDGRTIVPMYHPAAALRNGSLRGAIEDDFRKLPKILAGVEVRKEKQALQEEPPEPEPVQMTLF